MLLSVWSLLVRVVRVFLLCLGFSVSTPAMKHEELTQRIIGVFYTVYHDLGHGFLESIYQSVYGPSQRAGFHVSGADADSHRLSWRRSGRVPR